MRSKIFPWFLAIAVLTLMLAAAAPAAPPRIGQVHHWAYRSPIEHVFFFPQVLNTHHRLPRFFSWGMMNYNRWGQQFTFSFTGFNLARMQAYSLVYYPGDGSPTICLGQGTTNRMGFLNIQASADICSLPVAEDPNYPNGAMIMLVPSEDVACDEGLLFDPESSANLVTPRLIQFTDTDGCPVPEPVVTPPAEEAEEETPADEGTEVVDEGGENADDEEEAEAVEPEGESEPADAPYNGMPY